MEESISSFFEHWAEEFARAVEMFTGERPTLVQKTAEPSQSTEWEAKRASFSGGNRKPKIRRNSRHGWARKRVAGAPWRETKGTEAIQRNYSRRCCRRRIKALRLF